MRCVLKTWWTHCFWHDFCVAMLPESQNTTRCAPFHCVLTHPVGQTPRTPSSTAAHAHRWLEEHSWTSSQLERWATWRDCAHGARGALHPSSRKTSSGRSCLNEDTWPRGHPAYLSQPHTNDVQQSAAITSTCAACPRSAWADQHRECHGGT